MLGGVEHCKRESYLPHGVPSNFASGESNNNQSGDEYHLIFKLSSN